MTQRYKLVFFSPIDSTETVKHAIFATGAGSFPGGKYTNCAFQTLGTGQFKPVGDANPAIGSVGQIEQVEEHRVEIMCVGKECTEKAVAALKEFVPSRILSAWIAMTDVFTGLIHTRR